MTYRRRERGGNPYLTQALERIAILRVDCNMTEREIDEHGILSERTLRAWISGDVHKITRQRVVALERAVLRYGRVPWSEHHYGMADQMWQASRRGGQQAVIDSLRAECRRCSGSTQSAAKHDLTRARTNPDWAEDVSPAIYREGARGEVALEFKHYASLMRKHFSAPSFPSPSDAGPDDWTTVLLLIQFCRDGGAVDSSLVECLRTWLSTGCAHYPYSAWSQIVSFRLTEEKLIAAWSGCSSVQGRQRLLADLRWFDCIDRYTAVVEGNFIVARNALAAASAAHDRRRYRRWHAILMAQDSSWEFPHRLRALGYLDQDFDDFLEWWREVGGVHGDDSVSPNPDDPSLAP